MEENYYINLSHKVLSKQANQTEIAALQHWMDADAGHRALYEQLQESWQLSENYAADILIDTDAAWRRLQQTLGDEKMNVLPLKQHFNWFKVLAAACIIIAFCLIGLKFINKTEKLVWIAEYKADVQKMKQTLPDGSVITLDKGAVLQYGTKGNQRIAAAKGNLFFEVQKVPESPFVVQTASAKIRVLGTSFAVVAPTSGNFTEVHVKEGKVAFENDHDSIDLVGGESLVYNKSTQAYSKETLSDNQLSWKTELLRFDNARMNDVLRDLENYYQVTIELDNPSIQNCHFTGSFEQTDLDTVLNILVFSNNLKVIKQADKYILSGQGCPLSK